VIFKIKVSFYIEWSKIEKFKLEIARRAHSKISSLHRHTSHINYTKLHLHKLKFYVTLIRTKMRKETKYIILLIYPKKKFLIFRNGDKIRTKNHDKKYLKNQSLLKKL
jgi:hypothetical protein